MKTNKTTVVKHAKWLKSTDTDEDGYCSNCYGDMPLFRTGWNKWSFVKTRYCPHCGAKMDLEEINNETD